MFTWSFPGGLIVLLEPLDSIVDGCLDRSELEVFEVAAELLVAGGLLVLTVGLVGEELDLALELGCILG